MVKMNLQLFGGRGGNSGGMGAGGGSPVSPSSTKGRLVRQSDDQWYGENDNGSYAVINFSGDSDYNLYKYGNRRIYEVDRGISDSERAVSGTSNPPRLYAFTQSEATQFAKGWLRANKNK